jgi:hypothetical protein
LPREKNASSCSRSLERVGSVGYPARRLIHRYPFRQAGVEQPVAACLILRGECDPGIFQSSDTKMPRALDRRQRQTRPDPPPARIHGDAKLCRPAPSDALCATQPSFGGMGFALCEHNQVERQLSSAHPFINIANATAPGHWPTGAHWSRCRRPCSQSNDGLGSSGSAACQSCAAHPGWRPHWGQTRVAKIPRVRWRAMRDRIPNHIPHI